MMEIILNMFEDIIGKQENTVYQNFLNFEKRFQGHFPQRFLLIRVKSVSHFKFMICKYFEFGPV